MARGMKPVVFLRTVLNGIWKVPQFSRTTGSHVDLTYQYRSEPDFVAELKVDEFGLVTNCKDLWLAEATT